MEPWFTFSVGLGQDTPFRSAILESVGFTRHLGSTIHPGTGFLDICDRAGREGEGEGEGKRRKEME